MAWRMGKMCDNCPFARSGKGLHLRRTLQPGRWREILTTLRSDGHFTCHKTTEETGNGTELLCAGAIDWQEKHGCAGQLQRIMERIHRIGGNQATRSVVASFKQAAERLKSR